MTNAQDLLDAQQERFRALDPLLPAAYPLPRGGDPVMARMPDGRPVAGLSARTSLAPGSIQRLWSATETFELFPVLGHTPGAGMDALLAAWKGALDRLSVPDTDSACLVTWPSRDVVATRALLDHGFVPLACLAVRAPAPAPHTKLSGTVNMRRAGPADLDAVVELALTELEYAALVGGSVFRPDAAGLKRSAARVRLRSFGDPEQEPSIGSQHGDPVWLAERDGLPIGLAECGWTDAGTQPGGHRLPDGLWGYVNCLSVRPGERGGGVGRALTEVAHTAFASAGAVGSYLYYNPANPLSSVFWPRQGYRPLWTMWEIRPATALR